MKLKIQIYYSSKSSRTQRWRWRLKARNGKIIADSAEGYLRRRTAEKVVESIIKGLREYCEELHK